VTLRSLRSARYRDDWLNNRHVPAAFVDRHHLFKPVGVGAPGARTDDSVAHSHAGKSSKKRKKEHGDARDHEHHVDDVVVHEHVKRKMEKKAHKKLKSEQ
jgi:hypothetical protein